METYIRTSASHTGLAVATTLLPLRGAFAIDHAKHLAIHSSAWSLRHRAPTVRHFPTLLNSRGRIHALPTPIKSSQRSPYL